MCVGIALTFDLVPIILFLALLVLFFLSNFGGLFLSSLGFFRLSNKMGLLSSCWVIREKSTHCVTPTLVTGKST